jgi:hypothetical protein
MPIKTQPSTTIELLQNYIPYSTNGNVLVEDVGQMFSYSIEEPSTPVNLEFVFGATQHVVGNIVCKNLTSNAILEVKLDYDISTFIINPSDTFRLEPEQTRTIEIRVNVNDIHPGMVNMLKNIKVSVTNILNDSLVYKSNQSSLSKVLFNNTITLYE